jgi:hypothetical protein
VVDNPRSTKRKAIIDEEDMVNTDNVLGSCKLNGVACDFREKKHFSAKEICDKYNSGHRSQIGNPSAYVGSRSEAMQQRLSSHDNGKMVALLEVFIKKYVQCYGCGNPETEILISKTQMISL